MLVLAAGADSNDYLYGLSDVIRIARLDFVEPSITVVSLPRDLWVEIPGIEQPYGYTHGKLNQAYFFGGPGMGYYDGAGRRTRLAGSDDLPQLRPGGRPLFRDP
jgi:hypothetical protein